MTILRAMLVAAAFLVAAPWATGAARAYEAPWCAVIALGYGNAYWDCRYSSIETCRGGILAGNRGFCNPNPRYAGPPVSRRVRR